MLYLSLSVCMHQYIEHYRVTYPYTVLNQAIPQLLFFFFFPYVAVFCMLDSLCQLTLAGSLYLHMGN